MQQVTWTTGELAQTHSSTHFPRFQALKFRGRLKYLHGQEGSRDNEARSRPQLALFCVAMPVNPPSIVEIRAKMLLFQSKHELDFTPMAMDSRCPAFTPPVQNLFGGFILSRVEIAGFHVIAASHPLSLWLFPAGGCPSSATRSWSCVTEARATSSSTPLTCCTAPRATFAVRWHRRLSTYY